MSKEGIYIYCIIPTPEFSNDFRRQIDKMFDIRGINNRELSLVYYRNVAAVVSRTPVNSFDHLEKNELTSFVSTHQKVNEKVMKNYDVVPMSFGIIASSENEVQDILMRAHIQFKTALMKIEGKAEFVVQVMWDQKIFLEELANTNPEIQKLREEASINKGILGIQVKLKLGKLIYEEVEAHKKAYIKDIEAFFEDLFLEFSLNKLIKDDMIANISFLIEKNREQELDIKMQELGQKYEGKLRIKYIGPMPPYSFVNINLGQGNFELINNGRKLLGLGEQATFNEIKKTYYALAQKYHPDMHKNNKDQEEHIKKINQAYSILENYCRSCDECMDKIESRRYSFREEDVKNSLIIKSA